MKVEFKRQEIDISSAYPHSGLQFQIKYGEVGSTYFFLSVEEMKELREMINLDLKKRKI